MARKTKPVRKAAAPRAKRRLAIKAKPDRLDAFVVAAARALDLPARKSWLPAIETNLRVILQHAQSLGEFKLPDGAEPAPVFKA
jgi:hypothetical protein